MEPGMLQKLAQALRTRQVPQADPSSTMGSLQLADPYRKYVIDAQTNGQEPMPFPEFQKMMAQQQGG
jgi:hypothetical protein